MPMIEESPLGADPQPVSHACPLLTLPGTLLPSYDGHGISSLPASFLGAFGGNLGNRTPVAQSILPAAMFEGVHTVVFILVDGLGLARYRQEVEACPSLVMSSLARDGVFGHLTSVLPSTTTTALATLSTGLTPQEHGLMGYKLFLSEVGEVANMIRFSPTNKMAPYPRKRINPLDFFDHVTLYQQLADLGVTSRVIIRSAFANSPLSRMFYRGAEIIPHGGTHDAFVVLRRVLEQGDGSPSFVYLYWDPVDNVSHHNGPNSEEVGAEIRSFDFALRTYVLERHRDAGVAMVIAADHGHIHTVPARRHTFNRRPALLEMLACPPFGDSRLPYLAVRSGAEEAFAQEFHRQFGEVAALVPAAQALQAGWFGRGDAHPQALSRLGSFVVPVANGHKMSYRYSEEEFESIGCHGGVDPEEMLVPLIVARLA